jgi:predicted LPLAT superfamily acyltransferase/glycosyltransferase involved in cell wall biosynthesis
MTGNPFRPCAVVPSYNHWRAVGDVVARLRNEGLDVFIIDDGSDEPARSTLAALHDPAAGVTVHRFGTNQGKGAAVLYGFRAAFDAGFSHAIQVDADGQHDPAAIPELIERARRHPEALVTGVPVYDRTIPLGRVIGRWITHFWVWVETLSFRIRDSMCGFRVYPLAVVRALEATGVRLGRRMDFDTEIMVRLFWLGTPVAELPVRVTYPPDNTSNFRMLRDNVRISVLHTRLVVRMLLTFPVILGKRPPRLPGYDNARHWSAMGERGLYWGLAFCVAAYRLLGRKGCMAVMAPIVLYFYLTGTEQRRFSSQFLTRAFKARGWIRQPALADGYRHFMSFAGRTLDTFIGWTGGIARDRLQPGDIAALHEIQSRSRGALFIISHLGNVDLLRAVLDDRQRRRLTILVHTRHAENYNRILRKFNPEAGINLLQVTEMGPETAIALQERIDAGHWVMIAGDRTPVTGQSRVSTVPFLGEPASFSQGPYILAALLECPVYLLFCLRDGDHHRYHVEKLAEAIELPRGRRDEALRAYAATFAARLEHHALTDPFQWYNFFDFWKPQGGAAKT